MTISEQAVIAVAEALYPGLFSLSDHRYSIQFDNPISCREPHQDEVREEVESALKAAMPHIRKQIADEILAEVPVMGPQKSGKVYYAALMHAARIVTEE